MVPIYRSIRLYLKLYHSPSQADNDNLTWRRESANTWNILNITIVEQKEEERKKHTSIMDERKPFTCSF